MSSGSKTQYLPGSDTINDIPSYVIQDKLGIKLIFYKLCPTQFEVIPKKYDLNGINY